MKQINYNSGKLIFAPMEGLTDKFYRQAVMKIFPEWDFYFTQFLRVPNDGRFKKRFIIDHVGKKIVESEQLKLKTVVQIMPTENSNNIHMSKQVSELGIPWMDLNFCCPTKRVNEHKGGAYLLQEVDTIKKIINEIRNNFSHTLSAKIRIGYHDDKSFVDLIKSIESEGVDLITVHPRTRDQLFSGEADLSYIEEAVKSLRIPVIGNGEINNPEDIESMLKKTRCSSVMVGRGAVRAPWLAKQYKDCLRPEELNIKECLVNYFNVLEEESQGNSLDMKKNNSFILKRFKNIAVYVFSGADSGFKNGDEVRRKLLRSKNIREFKSRIMEVELNFHNSI